MGTVELTPATKVRGRVVDAEGKPVSITMRALIDDPLLGRGMGQRRYGKSNAEGSFEISGLGRHRYRVVLESEEWAAVPVLVDWEWTKTMPPGSYVVSLSRGGRELKSLPLEASGPDTSLDLTP